MEQLLEKRLGFTGKRDEKHDNNWMPVRNEYQKPTKPLLDAKIGPGLLAHVKRKSPCVRGDAMTIIHLCAA